MNNTAAYGRRRRVLYIKDPASAITHFIGAVGSAGASVPLLIKAAQDRPAPGALCDGCVQFQHHRPVRGQHRLSLGGPRQPVRDAAQKAGPHDDLCHDRRQLYPGLPAGSGLRWWVGCCWGSSGGVPCWGQPPCCFSCSAPSGCRRRCTSPWVGLHLCAAPQLLTCLSAPALAGCWPAGCSTLWAASFTL